MKNAKILAVFFSGLFAFGIQGFAQQTVYQVTFKGTIQSTNANGDIVSQKLNNQSYIQDALTAVSETTGTSAEAITQGSKTNKTAPPSLTLVYVQNASTDPSVTGDFVEVVSGTNNAPVYTNLLFLYGGIFTPALTNGSGTAYVAGAQVLPLPLAGSGQTLGGATINERTMAKKTLINGSFNYTSLMSPGSTNSNQIRIYSGSFNVGRQISP